MTRFPLLVFVFLAELIVISRAGAFNLTDHRQITRQAIDEFNFCMDGLVRPTQAQALESANIAEDVNLFRKWGGYSHFFHPERDLADMRRYDSSIRIIELDYSIEQRLRGRFSAIHAAYVDLGHAIHHIQDSASPSHVVPVMHSLDDGFESFPISSQDTPAFDFSPVHCDRFRRQAITDRLLSILDHVARATLDRVRRGRLQVSRNGVPLEVGWEFFWKESAGNSFGEYGLFGNVFGQSTFTARGMPYAVSMVEYRNMKRSQLRLAIDGTRRALHWFAAQDWPTR